MNGILTKNGFQKAWDGVPGYCMEPYMNYCRKIIQICKPANCTPCWLGSIDEVVEMSLTDVLNTIHDKIDQFDDNKGDFKQFLFNYCQHAYTAFLRKHDAFSKCQELEEGIIGLLKNERAALALTDRDPHQICAEEETIQFKRDVINKILKIVSSFSDRDKAIFETEYPAINIQEKDLFEICPILVNEPKNVVQHLAKKFGIKPGTVRTILSRLREKVRQKLEQEYFLDRGVYNQHTLTGFIVLEPEVKSLSQEEISCLTDDDCLLIWALMSLKNQMN